MFPLGRMVFPQAPPSGKPSSLGETFHHVTPTGMAYLYNVGHLSCSKADMSLVCLSMTLARHVVSPLCCYRDLLLSTNRMRVIWVKQTVQRETCAIGTKYLLTLPANLVIKHNLIHRAAVVRYDNTLKENSSTAAKVRVQLAYR